MPEVRGMGLRSQSFGALLVFVWTIFKAIDPASAGEGLAEPKSLVILNVTGKIRVTNAEGAARFDREMLIKLGTTTIATSTPWTEGVPEFEGVLVRDVLGLVGAQGDYVRAIALNDYVIDIPKEDFDNYPVLLALGINGNALQVRNKGPIWIIYPVDQFGELQNRRTERKMVWQLRELQVR